MKALLQQEKENINSQVYIRESFAPDKRNQNLYENNSNIKNNNKYYTVIHNNAYLEKNNFSENQISGNQEKQVANNNNRNNLYANNKHRRSIQINNNFSSDSNYDTQRSEENAQNNEKILQCLVNTVVKLDQNQNSQNSKKIKGNQEEMASEKEECTTVNMSSIKKYSIDDEQKEHSYSKQNSALQSVSSQKINRQQNKKKLKPSQQQINCDEDDDQMQGIFDITNQFNNQINNLKHYYQNRCSPSDDVEISENQNQKQEDNQELEDNDDLYFDSESKQEEQGFNELIIDHERNVNFTLEEKLKQKEHFIQKITLINHNLQLSIEENQSETQKLKQEYQYKIEQQKIQIENQKRTEQENQAIIKKLGLENQQLKSDMLLKSQEIQNLKQKFQSQGEELKQTELLLEEKMKIIKQINQTRENSLMKQFDQLNSLHNKKQNLASNNINSYSTSHTNNNYTSINCEESSITTLWDNVNTSNYHQNNSFIQNKQPEQKQNKGQNYSFNKRFSVDNCKEEEEENFKNYSQDKLISKSKQNTSQHNLLQKQETLNMALNKRSASFTQGSFQDVADNNNNSNCNNVLQKIKNKMNEDDEVVLFDKIREMRNFVDSIVQLILKCSPMGYINQNEQKSCLKQSWKFLKKVMEKYCQLKKNLANHEANLEIINKVKQYLLCTDEIQIIPKLVQIQIERETFKSIENKIKIILNLDWVKSLNELDRALVIEHTERFNSFNQIQK